MGRERQEYNLQNWLNALKFPEADSTVSITMYTSITISITNDY